MIQQPKEYLPLKQMLQDFSCFRDDAAYEVEVTNSNHIADQIKLVFPSCGAYPQFTLSDALKELPRICRGKSALFAVQIVAGGLYYGAQRMMEDS